jgi:hypothetical protein
MGLELVEFPAHLRKRATPTEMGFWTLRKSHIATENP